MPSKRKKTAAGGEENANGKRCTKGKSKRLRSKEAGDAAQDHEVSAEHRSVDWVTMAARQRCCRGGEIGTSLILDTDSEVSRKKSVTND